MDKLEFDAKGFLKPYKMIETNLEEFQMFFVHSFEESATREYLFAEYFDFIQDFKREVGGNIIVWIDGSFVTNKLNPNDLDLVILIDDAIYTEKYSHIYQYFNNHSKDKKYINLDIYTVRIYPTNHPMYKFSQSDKAYWYDWFTKTRKNYQHKQFQKGFIQLNF